MRGLITGRGYFAGKLCEWCEGCANGAEEGAEPTFGGRVLGLYALGGAPGRLQNENANSSAGAAFKAFLLRNVRQMAFYEFQCLAASSGRNWAPD